MIERPSELPRALRRAVYGAVILDILRLGARAHSGFNPPGDRSAAADTIWFGVRTSKISVLSTVTEQAAVGAISNEGAEDAQNNKRNPK
jgi:hypothetical protein